MSLADRCVVITGAGSGVGRVSAVRFAEEGATVVCADLRLDAAEETARMVKDAGGEAVAVPCDVGIEEQAAAAVAAAVTRFGRLDVMFNNAGIAGFRPGAGFDDTTGPEFDRLLRVNLLGVYHGCKAAVRQFKRQGNGGVIVNTGSMAGLVGVGAGGSVLYGVTKAAVHQLTRGLAIECAGIGIRVNAICPGAMPATSFIPTPDDQIAAVGQMHPLGRPIEAVDCANAAVYLASDAAKNVTGVLLPIDGGYVAA